MEIKFAHLHKTEITINDIVNDYFLSIEYYYMMAYLGGLKLILKSTKFNFAKISTLSEYLIDVFPHIVKEPCLDDLQV